MSGKCYLSHVHHVGCWTERVVSRFLSHDPHNPVATRYPNLHVLLRLSINHFINRISRKIRGLYQQKSFIKLLTNTGQLLDIKTSHCGEPTKLCSIQGNKFETRNNLTLRYKAKLMCETLSTTISKFTRLYLKMPVLNLSICKDAKVWSAKKLSHVAESKLCVSIFFWPK